MCFEIMDIKLFDPLNIVSVSRSLIMLKPETEVLSVVKTTSLARERSTSHTLLPAL